MSVRYLCSQVLMAALFVVTFSLTSAHAGDCINEWEFSMNGDPVAKIRQCIHSGGDSGYYELENMKGYTARMCWTIKFNDGRERRGCRTMNGYEVDSGSCYSCAPKNSGVRDIELHSFERQ